MSRTRGVLLSLALLAALPACGEKHYYSVDFDGNAVRVDADGNPLAKAMGSAPASASLSGVIRLDPALDVDPAHFNCVFVVARRAVDGLMAATGQIKPVSFPMSFRLSGGDSQHGGGLAPGDYIVTATLDADGDASPAVGDVQGVSAVMQPGGDPAIVVLRQVLDEAAITARASAGGHGAAPPGTPPFAPFAGGAATEATPEDLAGPRFKGTVELAPEFAALAGKYRLFIIVRSVSTGGAPLLSKLFPAATFPLMFDIGTECAPVKTDDIAQVVSGEVKVYARLAVSGDAKGGPGDIESEPLITSAANSPLVLKLSLKRTQ